MSDSPDDKNGMPPRPGGPADGTVLIPTPGGRSAAMPPPTEPQPSPVTPGMPPTAAPRVSPVSIPAAAVVPANGAAAVPITTSYSNNPVINHATTILAVMAKLRGMLAHDDPAGLQRQLTDEIKLFETRCQGSNLSAEQIVAARYLLCTAMDEAVMNTPWGVSSGWSQRSLLSTFHNETFGGEKFFQILDRLLQTPEQQLELLELVFLLISLGFEGKYKLDARGRDQLQSLQDQLYTTIEQLRGHREPELSPHWQSDKKISQGVMSYIPLWVVACCFLAILLMGYAGARLWLNQSTQPTASYLQQLSADITNGSSQ